MKTLKEAGSNPIRITVHVLAFPLEIDSLATSKFSLACVGAIPSEDWAFQFLLTDIFI